ncbi:MAG: hypothetical protein P4L43_16480 [Syntrophobacteraceae bacterium]|nr:hypothetical protein [Syntrophobacteraceae bacterium]
MGAPSVSVPSVPVTPPPPSLPDQGVQNAAKNQRELAAMQYGAEGTILTGSQGLQAKANTTASGKTLLG